MHMKKIFVILVAVIVGNFSSFAAENANPSENGTPSTSEVSSAARIIYDGKAYSAGNGLIPQADGSVSVYWTSEGCSVEGKAGYEPRRISGGTFMMRVNGKSKEMTHYVSYGGEKYFFQL